MFSSAEEVHHLLKPLLRFSKLIKSANEKVDKKVQGVQINERTMIISNYVSVFKYSVSVMDLGSAQSGLSQSLVLVLVLF